MVSPSWAKDTSVPSKYPPLKRADTLLRGRAISGTRPASNWSSATTCASRVSGAACSGAVATGDADCAAPTVVVPTGLLQLSTTGRAIAAAASGSDPSGGAVVALD